MKAINHFIGVVFLSTPLWASAQIDQYVIGSLGGEIQVAGGGVSFVQSIGDIAGSFVKGETAKFSQGFPQCFDCDNCETVDVVYLDAEVSFRLFPNPTTGRLMLEGDTEAVFRYRAFNAQGVLLIDKAFTGPQIDLDSLASGLYIILFSNKKGEWLATAKVVKE